ncbi:MAG: hypothetical protein M3A44_15140 [Gammaproteobacteria bacterium]
MKAMSSVLLMLCAFYCCNAIAEEQKPGKKTVPSLESSVKILESRISALESRVSSQYASLNCDTGKYDEFMFQLSKLVFFASCTKIEPYLEGHRITVQIGNPHAFNFSNVKGHLFYGKEIWDAFSNQVEISTTNTIRAGTWQTITVVVNPSTAEQMRSLILELSAETASAIQ